MADVVTEVILLDFLINIFHLFSYFIINICRVVGIVIGIIITKYIPYHCKQLEKIYIHTQFQFLKISLISNTLHALKILCPEGLTWCRVLANKTKQNIMIFIDLRKQK
jgi:hypothetical protein